MTKYNTTFELSPDDLELIEAALRQTKQGLSNQMIGTEVTERTDSEDVDGSLHRIQELLGRLHNQKVFYRPAEGAYLGG